MENNDFRVYSYRWVILLVFMFAVAMNQLLWITFASVTSEAARFFHVSDLQIGILSLSFMLVYIVVSIPASWIIDKFGIRIGVGTGVVLTGVFALLRGVFAKDYNLVLMSQIGIAVGQPFLINALTSVSARWFPVKERATATGLGSLAMYVGIIAGLVLTPWLTIRSGIAGMLVIYGVISIFATVVFLLFIRERPPTPPCFSGSDERSLITEGFRQVFHQRNFWLLMIIFFIGLGIFNAVTTWIEDIVRPREFLDCSGRNGGRADGIWRSDRCCNFACPFRPLPQKGSFYYYCPGWYNSGFSGNHFCRKLLVVAAFFVYTRFFPFKCRANWLSVWSRNYLSCSRRNVKRVVAFNGANIRYCIYIRNGFI